MDQSTPETLRRSARRYHALARALADPADRFALDDYAEVLNQQANDLENAPHAFQAAPART